MAYRYLLLFAILLPALAVNWAILTAGSSGYSNYRHQSDIFHTYQVLLKRGFKPENIITLAYDDIANSNSNPYHGKVFNKPTFKDPGVDVYEGVKIDYTGKHVVPKVFENILIGNQSYVKGMGTARVLKSTSEDNVFIYFSDHGSPGSISFPSGHLMADQLLSTLSKMKGMYKKLVFYLETCESGSMFVKLPNNTGIYAVSAAGTSESSWATYCSPNDVIGGKHIKSCLGDLFSVNFIEDLDQSSDASQTLQTQYDKVKRLTTESKVMQWGDKSFVNDNLSEMFGIFNSKYNVKKPNIFKNLIRQRKEYEKVSTYETKIHYLLNLYNMQKTAENLKLLNAELHHMKRMDQIFGRMKLELSLTGQYDVYNINFDCYRDSVNFFESNCAKLEDYNLQYMKYFVENCEKNSSEDMKPIIQKYCHEDAAY